MTASRTSRPWADSSEHEPADVTMRGPFHLLALHFLVQAFRLDGGNSASAMELDDCQRCGGWDGLAAWAARALDGRTVARVFVDVAYYQFIGGAEEDRRLYVAAFVDVIGAPHPGAEADALQQRWEREARPGHEQAGVIAGTLCDLLAGRGPRPHLALLLCVQHLVSALRLQGDDLDHFGHRLLEELALADMLPEHAARAPASVRAA